MARKNEKQVPRNTTKMVKCGNDEKQVPRNTTKMVRCGNDDCMIKGECRRYDETCAIKLVSRKRKCDHFMGM